MVWTRHALVSRSQTPTFVDTTVWHQIARVNRPPKKVPWIQLVTTDNRSFYGFYGAASETADDGTFTLSLKGPDLAVRSAPSPDKPNPEARSLQDWDNVYVPSSSMAFALVSYEDESPRMRSVETSKHPRVYRILTFLFSPRFRL